jgi:predicted 3-demethylubiquinone-9 3-methyltransferase (glyoxalase superfamily)
MPLAPSPVSEKFGWIQDKFGGVSWQLNLEKKLKLIIMLKPTDSG